MLLLEKFKERKAEMGLTHAKIAEETGLPLSTINSVFAGNVKNPSLITAGLLCKLFGISLDSHIGITNDEMNAAEIARIQAEYAQHEGELNQKIQEHATNLLMHEVTISNNQEIIRRQDLRIEGLEDRIKYQKVAIWIHRGLIVAAVTYAVIIDILCPNVGLFGPLFG